MADNEYTRTRELMDSARDLLVLAQGASDPIQSRLVYAAQREVQEVIEVIARGTGNSHTLAMREAYALSMDAVIREADRGSLLGFDPVILRGAIAIAILS